MDGMHQIFRPASMSRYTYIFDALPLTFGRISTNYQLSRILHRYIFSLLNAINLSQHYYSQHSSKGILTIHKKTVFSAHHLFSILHMSRYSWCLVAAGARYGVTGPELMHTNDCGANVYLYGHTGSISDVSILHFHHKVSNEIPQWI